MSILSTETQVSFHRGEFRGDAREYFGIWIVNILLTIVTLGIYSAWAKVRRNRYFYGNTFIDGHSFDYHARGKQIFIGRLIVLGIFIGAQIVATIFPLLGLALPLVFLAVLPWMIARGLRFAARVTSYRNIHFDFVGTAWQAFVAVILGGILASITFGIMVPFASRWLYRYIFNNLRYGDRAFSTDPSLAKLYRVWILPAVISLLGLLVLAAVGISIFGASLAQAEAAVLMQVVAIVGIYIAAIIAALTYFLAATLYRVGARNVVLQATLLDGRHRLYSDMSRRRYLWIAVSNLIVTIVSLGLMRPWAAVRERRYVVEHSGITFDGDIGGVIAIMQNSGAAVTAEYLEMEGFDFGF